MMRKNLTQTILQSLGRYIAIVAIIALGCSIFVGLKVTKTDMIVTGQEYTESQNMFDLRLLNTYGWASEQVEAVKDLPGVADAEGSIYLDVFASIGGGDESVYRLQSITEDINKVYLLGGRMPRTPDECLVDGDFYDEDDIGRTIVISSNNESDTLDSLAYREYTIVGYISTPLYMDLTRGSTSLGSGTITTYIYLAEDAFDVDYYTEIYVTLSGEWQIYSDEYNDFLDSAADGMEAKVESLAQQRFAQLLADAEQAYADGIKEYSDGLEEFENGRAEALQALDDALAELNAAQEEINAGVADLKDGEEQLNAAQAQIDEGRAKLEAAALELERAKSEAFTQMADGYTELMDNYKTVTENLALVNGGLAQIDDGLAQVEDGLSQIESSLPLLEVMVNLLELQVKTTEAALDAAVATGNELLAQSLQTDLDEANAQLDEYQGNLTLAQSTKTELEATQIQLQTQRSELVENQSTLSAALETINLGFKELETNQSVAENKFAAAEAEISAGTMELDAGQAELDANRTELEAGKAELDAGQATLDASWEEYYLGKAETMSKLESAEAELADAKQELEDARESIDSMTDPTVYTMTRNTNTGYLALDSNSDIVSGIARILPVFFMLIAALVCITTMTRMVEEERTQIGTLKSLGYSNGAIMGKYIWYSVSASIIGCVLGVVIGSTFFPNLLWNAYAIILSIRPNVSMVIDWGLSLGVSLAYIAVSTFVTWYCCRRTLREVPAELIRPKSPDAGKKIFLEYLPFWKNLSFLNKVTLRNVFRYRQRFLMMLIGIGGCTGLLITGFGMMDTIVDIANIQYETVERYDIEVYFSEGRSEADREAFLDQLQSEKIASDAGFFYQASVELDYDSQARDVYLIAADDGIQEYLSFHYNGENLSMPGKGEALMSIGVAEVLNISVGDTIEVRNSDLETLTLTVAGFYENHVYNYVIVTPETVQDQWGRIPQVQMAFVTVYDDANVHEAGAAISTFDDVLGINVCEDSANMVANMMDALNLVIAVVILAAGTLGAVVLYNLTNININERIREIATIKVLGFNASETSAYVFKENIVLTVLGAAFGIGLGRLFLEFVMDNIKVDMVWFKTRLTFPSYIYALLLTFACAVLVDLVFYRKLDRINMAEALKSVE